MSATAFVLGNGESRRGIKIAEMQKHGKVYACNGVYRTETPDYLIAVDPKMILEIAEGDYMTKHSVWSNFNAQYNKNDKILNHVQWFKPSLGWSSGPTALRMALDHGHTEVYILGFDYQGHTVKDKGNRFKFNNIFKDSRNYKRSRDDATFYGNWMNQTKRCLSDFKNVKFYRVIPKGWFQPKDLDWNQNLTHISIDDFIQKFDIKVDK
tara:strand:+ start:33 stop:659 length:627 start_codon:yes stop_codon:yes gene_type:complete